LRRNPFIGIANGSKKKGTFKRGEVVAVIKVSFKFKESIIFGKLKDHSIRPPYIS
jgi:hypothetical protein